MENLNKEKFQKMMISRTHAWIFWHGWILFTEGREGSERDFWLMENL
jgi:hypothetical protein